MGIGGVDGAPPILIVSGVQCRLLIKPPNHEEDVQFHWEGYPSLKSLYIHWVMPELPVTTPWDKHRTPKDSQSSRTEVGLLESSGAHPELREFAIQLCPERLWNERRMEALETPRMNQIFLIQMNVRRVLGEK